MPVGVITEVTPAAPIVPTVVVPVVPTVEAVVVVPTVAAVAVPTVLETTYCNFALSSAVA